MRLLTGSVLLTTAALVVACGASTPVPADKVTQTQAAIRAAEEVGAPNVPKAALHLKMARDQFQTAQGLIAEEENEQATLVIDRARVDAELALALARESDFRAKAAEQLEKVKKLQQDIKDAQGGQ